MIKLTDNKNLKLTYIHMYKVELCWLCIQHIGNSRSIIAAPVFAIDDGIF